MEQIICHYWNEELKIALADVKTAYLLDSGWTLLKTEVYKGLLVYRLPGSSKRFSYNRVKEKLIKKKIVISVHLPF